LTADAPVGSVAGFAVPAGALVAAGSVFAGPCGEAPSGLVGAMVAGRTYQFELVRYGERQGFSVKIGERDDKDEVAQYKNLWPGMTVVKITDDIRKEAGIDKGVEGVVIGYIPDENTPSAIAGFRPGDVITEINGRPVRTMMDFYRGINDRSKKDVSFRINRKNVEVTIGLAR